MDWLLIWLVWVVLIGLGVRIFGGIQRKNEEEDRVMEEYAAGLRKK